MTEIQKETQNEHLFFWRAIRENDQIQIQLFGFFQNFVDDVELEHQEGINLKDVVKEIIFLILSASFVKKK